LFYINFFILILKKIALQKVIKNVFKNLLAKYILFFKKYFSLCVHTMPLQA